MPTTLRTDGTTIEITMLPVAAGDATLIVWSDGGTRHTVLIDAGLQKDEAVSYLQSIGIFHLDLIILSHPDLDHLGGLLAIVKSRAMSVDRIWCFDLDFLRTFIRTGTIPPPKPATREVVYAYLLRSTLDQFADILKSAYGKQVQIRQVCEGYKLCLGNILLEVLYPPQSFYDALHSPISLKRMLKRKVPVDWNTERGAHENEKARTLSGQEQHGRLTEGVERPQMREGGFHLCGLEQQYKDESSNTTDPRDEGPDDEAERLPWRMVGTLYNNLSIVVKLTVLGGINSPAVLFPGDLSDWTTLVLRQWPNLKADILKMPHHGSRNVTCDLTALQNAMNAPFPWYRLTRRGGSLLYPFLSSLSRSDVRSLYRSVHQGDPLQVIHDVVSPSHVLVFPHPQHHLPSLALGRFGSTVIANRTQREELALCQASNIPIPARIVVGLERHEVTEV